jgi:hypothetical protein
MREMIEPTREFLAINEGGRVLYESFCDPDDPNWDDLPIEHRVEYISVFRTALAMFMRTHGRINEG